MSINNVIACDVCFEDYDESDRKLLVLPCTHYFCRQCLLQLQTSGNKKCPTCRNCWADTTVDKLVVYRVLDHERTVSTKAATECSATATCKHPDYAVQIWCRDCKVLLCKNCLNEHIDCNWSLMFEVFKDILEEHNKHGVTNRITVAISETEKKLANVRAVIEGLRLQKGELVEYNTYLSYLLKTTLNELSELENVLLENQDIVRLQEVMDTVKELGATTLPEPQLSDFQSTISAGQPSPTPSSSLLQAAAQTSSPSTDQASNLTQNHDPDTLCATFLSASEQQRNEVRVS